jgi:hypothetical protein
MQEAWDQELPEMLNAGSRKDRQLADNVISDAESDEWLASRPLCACGNRIVHGDDGCHPGVCCECDEAAHGLKLALNPERNQ